MFNFRFSTNNWRGDIFREKEFLLDFIWFVRELAH